MKKQRVKNHWTPVVIDSNLLQKDLDLDGLIGIEECTDYCLENFVDPKINSNHVKSLIKPNETSKNKKKIRKKNAIGSSDKIEDDLQMPSKTSGSTTEFIVTIEDSKETVDLKAWSIVPLHDKVLLALKDMNFYYPTDIQMLTLPAAILGKRDILGAAETGSGKTLAFGLPIVEGILKHKESTIKNLKEKPLYALILAPTRELAIQIKNHLTTLMKYTGLRVAVVVGGLASAKQERILDYCPEIVVATPGRLWELIQQGNEHLSHINEIKYLAIDETDRMLERGHFKELELILERINMNETLKQKRQNFVFSATLTLIHELPSYLIMKRKLKLKKQVGDLTPMQKLKKIVGCLGITNPKVVDITQKSKGAAKTLTECKIVCSIEEKDYYVYYFLQRHPGKTLIFCNSIGCVKRLTTLLGLLGCEVMALHASMQQRQRLKNLDRFTEKVGSILIATDVAARGLDIPAVDHVLHYQTPRTAEGYIHRSGRTARASAEGITTLLIEENELHNYLRLCRTLEKTEDIPSFPVQQHFLNAIKNRVNLAREVDKLDFEVKKANSESSWYEKAAEQMDIIVDNPSLKYDIDAAHKCRKAAQMKRKQLAALLTKPIFPKGLISEKYPFNSNNIEFLENYRDNATDSAINVMKTALNTKNISKKRPHSMFKSRVNSKTTEHINMKELMESGIMKKKYRTKT